MGTQVAEISLNVSFDLLISELAPIDSLIQRGGRLHRRQSSFIAKECTCGQCKRLKPDHTYYFHIFDTGDLCFPYYTSKEYPLMKEIIDRTRNEIISEPYYTFCKGMKMMNNVYANDEFFRGFNPTVSFFKPFIEDLIFGKEPFRDEEKGGQLRITTRKIEEQQLDVLPTVFEYGGEDISAKSFIEKIYSDKDFIDKDGKLNPIGINELSKHLLRITSRRYFLINRGEDDLIKVHKFIRVVKQHYNFEYGLHEFETIT